MYNMHDLLKAIKRAAVEAVDASKPTNVVFGTVISKSPLKIKIDQKLTLGYVQLVLSRTVTETTILNKGDEVILMQMSGGQKYVVIDKVGKG